MLGQQKIPAVGTIWTNNQKNVDLFHRTFKSRKFGGFMLYRGHKVKVEGIWPERDGVRVSYRVIENPPWVEQIKRAAR